MNVVKFSLLILLISMVEMVYSQPIEIISTQDLDFGTVSQYDVTGGTVTVSNTGSRLATGNIALIGSTFSLAAFTIILDNTLCEDDDGNDHGNGHGNDHGNDHCDGQDQFSLQIDSPTVSLSGSNGGSLLLHIGTANPEFPSVENGTPTTVYVGGTLTIGSSSANPPGTYSGNVVLYFNLHYE